MTKKQLQEAATRKGIKFNSKTTKAELIAALDGAKPEAVVGPKTGGEY